MVSIQCQSISDGIIAIFAVFVALNEKAGKWICPVCNKPALFDDLQIDSYTESILNSIKNENITEITIDGDLHWKPVASQALVTEQRQARQVAAHTDDIVLDDDDEIYTYHEPIDSKANIPLLTSSADERADLILIDED